MKKIMESIMEHAGYKNENNYNGRKDKFDIKVGDIVGNTVDGFDFEVLKVGNTHITVRDTVSGKERKSFIGNMYLPGFKKNEAKPSMEHVGYKTAKKLNESMTKVPVYSDDINQIDLEIKTVDHNTYVILHISTNDEIYKAREESFYIALFDVSYLDDVEDLVTKHAKLLNKTFKEMFKDLNNLTNN